MGGMYGFEKVGNSSEHWQSILNQSWPLVDAKGKPTARGIRNRDPIAVRVRVVFERDGEVWLEGSADRWHGQCVHVAVVDPRLAVNGVWVHASDVLRLTT